MRTLVFVEAGKLEWREVADARIRAGCEAVIRTLVMGRGAISISAMFAASRRCRPGLRLGMRSSAK